MVDAIAAFFLRLYENGFPDFSFWTEIFLFLLELMLTIALGAIFLWMALGICFFFAYGKWINIFSSK